MLAILTPVVRIDDRTLISKRQANILRVLARKAELRLDRLEIDAAVYQLERQKTPILVGGTDRWFTQFPIVTDADLIALGRAGLVECDRDNVFDVDTPAERYLGEQWQITDRGRDAVDRNRL